MKAATALLLLALLLFPGAPARAEDSETTAFHQAVAESYRHMRSAIFYARTGNPAPVVLELDQARAGWRDLAARFAEAPPPPYKDDAAWQEELAKIGAALDRAMTQAEAGDLPAAGATLKPLRAGLADLRARNGVTVFSDCVDEASRRMARLWVHQDPPPSFDDEAALQVVRVETAALTEQIAACDAEAVPATRDNPQFRDIVEGMQAALARIETAIERRDELLLVNTLRELNAFDRMLWLTFG